MNIVVIPKSVDKLRSVPKEELYLLLHEIRHLEQGHFEDQEGFVKLGEGSKGFIYAVTLRGWRIVFSVEPGRQQIAILDITQLQPPVSAVSGRGHSEKTTTESDLAGH